MLELYGSLRNNDSTNGVNIQGSDIVIRGVGKAFTTKAGGVLAALQGVDLDITSGEFVSLVGQSGCGKSTLLNMLCGLTRPSEGEIQLRGEKVEGPRADVGYMQQTPVLLPWRTVLRNVMLPYDIRSGDYNHSDVVMRALKLLNFVGLEEFKSSYPRELSGGMQQRVALVRTLAYEPRILLMDEPFASLDEFNREALNLELMRLWTNSGITVVFVTHNIQESVFLSDRVVVMSSRPGRIASIVEVPLSRPRMVQHMFEPKFVNCVRDIRSMLNAEGSR